MKVTPNGIAIALAVIVVLGFFLFGIVNPFGAVQPATDTQSGAPQTDQMGTSTGATTTSTNPTELMGTDTVVGTGAEAKTGDSVTVNYVGMLENGTVFDASANHGQPFTFTLGAGMVIQGWDQGIVGMKVGGKRHLVIPSAMAYGDRAVGNIIPANATLVFDVELVDVKPSVQ